MSKASEYKVNVYERGANASPTRCREYVTWRAAKRYQDSWVRRGIVAVAERVTATVPASHWRS